MTDNKPDTKGRNPEQTVTDDQIVTERKVHRRSFLSATGAVLGGAAGMVTAAKAAGVGRSPQDDPDKRPVDPNKRTDDPSRRTDDPNRRPEDAPKRAEDRPKKRADDARKKTEDPDKRPPADPDKRPDAHK